MAYANFDGLNLRITLDRMQRTAAGRKEFVVPLANLAGVVYSPDIWDEVQHHTATVMGIRYPDLVLVGTVTSRAGTDFCLLGKTGPGLAIGLRGHQYDRILLSLPAADAWPLFARLREVTRTPVERG
jgi:hypothetical protein